MKSANKLWKESGTTLSFKEWIDRENKKKEPQKLYFESNLVKDTLDKSKEEIKDVIRNEFPDTPEITKNKTLGLSNAIIIGSTLLILGSLGVYFYKKYKKQ
jgi:hypothetical protein